MEPHAILWRRLDLPGHESARLLRDGGLWRLAGTAVLAHEGRPCRLDYEVVCDGGWRTRAATVEGWIGPEAVRIEVAADEGGRWRLNGEEHPGVAGCLDVDLGFSPSTNLLPVRRLELPVGGEAPVRAAWLRFPGLVLEPLDQVYRRTGPAAYVYSSAGGRFVAELEVNAAGMVTRYGDYWVAEAGA